jgi:antitoxin component YwqK of YwqJK toxin-antitoxin module
MKFSKLILITFIIFSCSRKIVSIIKKTDSTGKVLKINSVDTDKIELHQSFYVNGILEYEAEMRDGIPDGYVKYWNERGNLISVAHYENGKLNGFSLSYYENEIISSKTEYFYGEIHGIQETYYESGYIKSNQTFEFGKPKTQLLRFDLLGNRIYQP